MSAGTSNNGTRGCTTTTARITHPPILAQMRFDNQGQIRQKTPSEQEKEKQAEREKETGSVAAKRPITAQPTTRGTATEPESLTQYKAMLRQVTNALRSIALVMEQLDDDARGDRIAD